MRDLVALIAKMLEVIPEDEIKLREDLAKASKDSCFRPPELQRRSFNEVAEILGHRFGEEEPVDGWQKQMDDIWFDREVAT